MSAPYSHRTIVFLRRASAFLAFSGFMAAGFVNCSSPSVPSASGSSKAASTSVLSVSPLTQTVDPGTSLQLVVSGGTLPYTYQVTGGGGTVSATGIFLAPSTSDSTTIYVTDAAGMMVSSEITTYVSQTSSSSTSTIVSALVVSASSTSLSPGGQATLSATGGSAPYTYSLSSVTPAGTGSVSGAIFTAGSPSVAQSATVLATDSAGATASVVISVSAPAMLWTWQGLRYQTTCPSLCDGVEWATCSGTSCPAARMQCYTASPKGQPGHPIGTTQTTTPSGYMCSSF